MCLEWHCYIEVKIYTSTLSIYNYESILFSLVQYHSIQTHTHTLRFLRSINGNAIGRVNSPCKYTYTFLYFNIIAHTDRTLILSLSFFIPFSLTSFSFRSLSFASIFSFGFYCLKKSKKFFVLCFTMFHLITKQNETLQK